MYSTATTAAMRALILGDGRMPPIPKNIAQAPTAPINPVNDALRTKPHKSMTRIGTTQPRGNSRVRMAQATMGRVYATRRAARLDLPQQAAAQTEVQRGVDP